MHRAHLRSVAFVLALLPGAPCHICYEPSERCSGRREFLLFDPDDHKLAFFTK